MAFKEDEDINLRYDALKRRLEQQTNAQKQQSGEGLARKFAAMGTLNSGAQIKLEQKAAQQIDEQSQLASNEIEGQRIGEQQKRKMIEEERGWQSGEAEKGRQFALTESEKQRGFAREEGEIGRKFAREEGDIGRKFAMGEREASQKFAASESATAREMQQKMFDSDMVFKQKMADLQDRQWSNDYKLREDEQAFNKAMAERMADRKGLLDRISNPTDSMFNPVAGAASRNKSTAGYAKTFNDISGGGSEWRF